MAKPFFKTPDGTKYEIKEALYPVDITVFRSDEKKAIVSDPFSCAIALGIKRLAGVIEAYIGTGSHAYIIFKATKDDPAHALHFVIATGAAKIRDEFDKDKKIKTQKVRLLPPSPSQTLAKMAAYSQQWRDEVESGKRTPVSRGAAKKSRFARLGLVHRPRANVKRNGVSFPASATV